MSVNDEIRIVGGNRARIKPGEYDATVISCQQINKFNRKQVLFKFRLFEMGPADKVEVEGYAALGHDGSVRPDSKLARWSRLIADWDGRRKDRISLSAFKKFCFRVEIETVIQDREQKPLAEINQYEVVRNIVAVLGRLRTERS
jgi:hypothetical protein